MLGRYPTACLNWRSESGKVSVLVLGASHSGNYSLADFIENQYRYRHFASQPVRWAQRLPGIGVDFVGRSIV